MKEEANNKKDENTVEKQEKNKDSSNPDDLNVDDEEVIEPEIVEDEDEPGESDSDESELDKALREKEELKSVLQRVQADFSNYRKRSAAEKNDIYKYALFDFVCKILPVLDNMERARESAEKEKIPKSYLEGLDMIRKQIDQLLEQHGVNPIEAKGCEFDPHYHDAVMMTDEGEGEPNTVVDELQRGYIMEDRVLRPAMVKVYKGSEEQ